MKPSEDIKPITYLKTNAADLAKDVSRNGRPVIITQSGEARMVILGVEQYEKEKEAFLMMKYLAQGLNDFEHESYEEQDVFFKKLGKKIENL